MKVERAGQSAFAVTVGAPELSALIAAVRLAADIVESDDTAPAGAAAQLRGLADDFDRAVARLTGTDGRSGRPS